ncbi:MAG: heparin lyase I family protein [Gaiellaceae bacterium]
MGLIVLAGIVSVILSSRSSRSPVVALDWETGDNSQFSNLECPHPSTQFAIVTSPVRSGRYAARFSETSADIWDNGTVRCLDALYDTAATTGDDYYFGVSVYIPAPGLSDNLVWELHQPRDLYTLSDCGVAPFAILVEGGKVEFRIVTGDCTVGKGLSYLQWHIPFPDLNPYPRNRWIDFVVHVRFEEAATGLVQVWSRTDGPWTTKPEISRTDIPTMPYCSSCGIYNADLYVEMGLYPGYSGYAGRDTIYIDDYRRGNSFADVAASALSSSRG